MLGQQRRAVGFDQRCELAAQLAFLERDLADPLEDQLRDADLRAVSKAGDSARDPRADLRVIETGWREAGLEVWGELHQMPPQSV